MFVHDGEKIKLRKVSFELLPQGEHPCRAEKIPRLLGDLTHPAFLQLHGEE